MSENEISDSQFGKTFAVMLGAMVALTIVLIILAFIVGSAATNTISDVNEAQRIKEVVARTAPVGEINVGTAPAPVAVAAAAPAASAEPVSGKSVYESACASCHGAGVAGAPKFGDGGAWQARIAQGKDTLYEHAVNGFQGQAGYMPAKGGNAQLTDAAVKAAVDHMLEAVQ